MRIFDCCIYNGERELWEARRHEWERLGNVTHVAASFAETFQGNPNPNMRAPGCMGDAFVISDLHLPGRGATPWEREGAARDWMGVILNQLEWRGWGPAPADDDLIFLCDGDEIVKSSALEGIVAATSFGPACLPCPQHYYDLWHLVDGPGGRRTKAARWRDVKPYVTSTGLRHLWDSNDLNGVTDACWHYSMLGGARRVYEKLMSFSHTELQDEPNWVTLENVERLIAEHRDLVPPPNDRAIVPCTWSDAPEWLAKEAQTRWQHLLDPTLVPLEEPAP